MRSAELQITLRIPEHQQAFLKLLHRLSTEGAAPPGRHVPTCWPQHLAGRQHGGTGVKISLPLNSWQRAVKTVDVLPVRAGLWGAAAGFPPYTRPSYTSHAGQIWTHLNHQPEEEQGWYIDFAALLVLYIFLLPLARLKAELESTCFLPCTTPTGFWRVPRLSPLSLASGTQTESVEEDAWKGGVRGGNEAAFQRWFMDRLLFCLHRRPGWSCFRTDPQLNN